MGRIKLVITDLDGTFLDNNSEPNKRNIEALKACEAAGVPVRAITARCFTMARRILDVSGFRGHCVTCNGASLYEVDSGQRLYKKAISKDCMARILRLCKAAQADGFVIARDYLVQCQQLRNSGRMLGRKKADMSGWPKKHRFQRIEVDTVDDAIEYIGNDGELICMHAPDDTVGFAGEFYRSVIELGELSLTSSHPGGFDIMASGVCKSAGAQRLADMMGIRPEEVLACGDHNNDIGMLRWAGIGVAMGDAHPGTKMVADYVSVPHLEGGVADAIYRFVL